jgi:hypothetical protein
VLAHNAEHFVSVAHFEQALERVCRLLGRQHRKAWNQLCEALLQFCLIVAEKEFAQRSDCFAQLFWFAVAQHWLQFFCHLEKLDSLLRF